MTIADNHVTFHTQSMEQLVRDGVTKTVGVADLMRPQMEELYKLATVSTIPPSLHLSLPPSLFTFISLPLFLFFPSHHRRLSLSSSH